jgi:Prenyltransferase and squalene oxidase repeat
MMEVDVHNNVKKYGALVGVVVFAFVLGACRYTGFGNAPAKASAASAVGWLVDQQQSDGGFELAGFPGFETPDAILAIAENAQQQRQWNTSQALTAVRAVETNGNDPLHAVDNWVDSTAIDAGQAAKVIVLVAKPLGLSVTAFNPDGDTAKNLVTVVNGGLQPNGSYGAFNATLYAAMAKKLVDNAVPANTVTYIRNAQEAGGGWDFAGDPTGSDADVDTTAIAVAALAAAGASGTDADLRAGLRFLALKQNANGGFPSPFATADPNSTASGVFGVVAAGFDPDARCWRDLVAPERAAQGYTAPSAWLRSQQVTSGADAGRITSPNDDFGITTFATSQAVQALRYAWMPPSPLAPQSCP